MNLIDRAKIYFSSVYILLRNQKINANQKFILFCDFNRYTIKTILLRYFNANFNKERLLRYEIEVDHYPDFVSQFVEIFIHFIYFFDISKNKPNIIDGGSNIGVSIIFFKYMYPNATIIGFEPDPLIYKKLQNNINKNKLNKVSIKNRGLFSYSKGIKFYNNSSSNPLYAKSVANSIYNLENKKDFINISTMKLSNYLDTKVDILKLDIEGAESEVIKEAEVKLDNVTYITLEFHIRIELKNNNLSDILKVFERKKFSYWINEAEGQNKKFDIEHYIIIKAKNTISTP